MSRQRLRLTLILTVLFVFSLAPWAEAAALVHRVAAGESLHAIAAQYGVTEEKLVQLNNLDDPNAIFARQVIIVPKPPANVHVVRTGDTLYRIANQHGLDVQSLVIYNGLTDPGMIRPGQWLKIPPKPIVPAAPGGGQATVTPKPPVAPKPPVPQPPTQQQVIQQLFKKYPSTVLRRGPSTIKQVALTFDDGPDNRYTPQILDLLRREGVPATFFLVGGEVGKYPEVVQRILAEGHVVANHSWSHPNFFKQAAELAWDQVYRTEKAIYDLIGLRPALFRPPYGALREENVHMLAAQGYKAIHWSADSFDWRTQDVDQILINVLPDTRRGGIILMHSAGGTNQNLDATVGALPELIYTLRVQGYKFVTVDELLSIPAYK